jgi:hypothetical protein
MSPDITPAGDPGPDPGDRRDPEGGRRADRRRVTWRDFRRAYPGFVFTLLIGLMAMLAIDAFLIIKHRAYEGEVARLRSNMSEQEKARTDAIVAAEENKLRIALALARRQAKLEKKLHLSVDIDSGSTSSAKAQCCAKWPPPSGQRGKSATARIRSRSSCLAASATSPG